ncbi:MAG: type IV pilus biogenesis protein PilM [Lachnospirales bacterium]
MKKNKTYLSVSLSNRMISVIEGGYTDKFNLKKYFTINLDEGIIKNGCIYDKDALKDAFMEGLKANRVKSKVVLCTFDSTEVLTREIDTVKLDNSNDLELLIKNEINKQLLINTNDFIIRYKHIETFKDGINEKQRFFVSAMPKDMGEDFYNFFKSCRLKGKVLELSATALENLVSVTEDDNLTKGNVVILETTKTNVRVNILKNGRIRFLRNIDLVSLELGKEDFANYEKITGANADYVTASTKINKLTNDVGMIIKFYTSRNLGNGINKSYIYGYLSGYEKLIEELRDKTELQIEKMEIADSMLNIEIEEKDKYYNNLGVLLNNLK